MPDSTRAGRYIQQTTGYRAFIPAPLPPEPSVAFDGELLTLLSQADRDLGRLDAIARLLPNPDLFVAMYVRHEAVLSSQIEGTQSTLEDVLAFENPDHSAAESPGDVEEVVNYVRAMNHGLARLADGFPLSLRLLREIHAELMQGVRGGDKTPGEFRRSQNWIGPAGSTLAHAAFVPPPPHELPTALGELENFLHQHRQQLPLLVRCGLAWPRRCSPRLSVCSAPTARESCCAGARQSLRLPPAHSTGWPRPARRWPCLPLPCATTQRHAGPSTASWPRLTCVVH